ncbi:MAG: bacteriophage abortive infection AbiH family protein [Clostridia bacterium]
MKLFIIGNGFDSAHKFKTKYSDFREFLIKNYPYTNCWGNLPQPNLMHGGDIGYNENECASFIVDLIDGVDSSEGLWSELELYLAMFDFTEYFDDIAEYGEKPFHAAYKNEDNSSYLTAAVSMISKFFDEWVSSIDIRKGKPSLKFKKLIDKENDLFLNFNYTSTLQTIYGTKNVVHIHGKQGEEIFFGHGERMEYDEDNFAYKCGKYFGADLNGLHNALRKKTEDAFFIHHQFFKGLKNAEIDSIYSMGFSFSDIDMVYLERICECIDTKGMTWYLNDFNSVAERNQFIKKIKDCGYEGLFDTFTTA